MKDSVLIFGGGELQISIIKKAKELEFRTIVIDPNASALAKTIADVFIQVNGDDFEKTLEIAKTYEIKGVLTAATDHPILMMSRIAAALELNFPSYTSCNTLLDKGKFKVFLEENDILHAKGMVLTLEDDYKLGDLKFPLIVKPVQNSGSRGVIKCDRSDSIHNAVHECIRYCRDGRFIIEEYIEGDEISVEAIVSKGEVKIIQITDKFVSEAPYNVELGHMQPSKFFPRQNEIRELLQRIIDLTGLDSCVIHPEFKIKSGGEIVIIEIGPRLGGDYITSDLTPLSTGINIEELQIFLAIGRDFYCNKLNMYSAISFFNFQEGARIKETITEKELIERYPQVNRFSCMLKVGDKVHKITNSLERYGYFIIQSSSHDLLKSSIYEINQFLQTKFIYND